MCIRDRPWVDTAYSGRSDYKPFIDAGIPASGLFTGADGTKTEAEVELFGGTAGIIHDPNYHTPKDTIDNVSVEAIDIMSDAIAFATLSLAMDTSAVNGHQNPGDKGKERREKAQQAAEQRRQEAAERRDG